MRAPARLVSFETSWPPIPQSATRPTTGSSRRRRNEVGRPIGRIFPQTAHIKRADLVPKTAGDVTDATSTPLSEARETNGITSRLMLAYAERQGGREAVEAVLRHAALEGREAELRDENTWFSFDAKVRLFDALAAVPGAPAATRKAGALSLELNVADGLKLALRALGSPRLVYQQIVRANAKFTTRHAMELVELGHHHARISFRDLTGGDVHRLDCAYNVGLLSCVPALFGRAPARVTHPVCAVDGAEKCLYDITWAPPGGVSLRAGVAHGAAAGAAVLGAAVAAPAL